MNIERNRSVLMIIDTFSYSKKVDQWLIDIPEQCTVVISRQQVLKLAYTVLITITSCGVRFGE